MFVKIDNTDVGTIAYIGVTDFFILDDGRIELYWPPDADAPHELTKGRDAIDGVLRQATDHNAYDDDDLTRTIKDLRANDDVTVHVTASEEFPRLAEFAEE